MTDFKVTRAYLYRMGVGWFVAEKNVTGKNVFFPLPANSVDDFLKTAVIQVESEKDDYVLNLSFDTRNTLTEFFETSEGITGLLDYLRAKEVEVHLCSGKTLKGRIIGYEEMSHGDAEKPVNEHFIMSFYHEADQQLLFIPINDVQSVFPVDEKQRELFIEHLLTASSMDDAQKEVMMKIQFKEEAEKALKVKFLSEIPAWKITYRAYLQREGSEDEDTQKVLLETWGIVDNNTKIDWVDCHLTLSTLLPVSFKYDLSTPLMISRPVVERETTMGIEPSIPETERMELDDLDYDDEYPEFYEKAVKRGFSKKRAMAVVAPAPVPEAYKPARSQAKASKDEFGESVIFELTQPVTIKKGQSAMVPLSTATVSGRRILLFNEKTHDKHPVQVLDFKNTLDYALDKGPISVYEGTQFLGEGMIPRLGLQEQYFLPFALDQDVVLHHKQTTRTKYLKTGIEGKYSFELMKRFVTHTWDVENKGKQEKTLIIELEKPQDFKLEKPEDDDKELDTVWRFKVIIPSRKKIKVKRVISRELKNKTSLNKLSQEQVKKLLETADLSDSTKKIIEQLVKLKNDENRLYDHINELERTYNKNRETRDDLLKSLKVIKDTKEEQGLRLEYLNELSKIDAENKKIKTNLKKQRTELRKVQTAIQRLLLELDV